MEKYPDVTFIESVEALFDDEKTIDLLGDVVEKYTEWPCFDHSIKTLAIYLGFKWRDENLSGAASIEWYHNLVESGDDAIKELTAIDKISEFYYKKDFLNNLVEKVYYENIIDEEYKNVAYKIRKLRNRATHDFRKISDDEIHKIIQQTKDITESILKPNY